MKIAIIDDQCSGCNEGGSQKNSWGLIQEGIKRNHKIRIITPQNMSVRSLEGVDVVIFVNIMSFTMEQIEAITSKHKYIFSHRDFNFYKFRLFYPVIKGDYRGIKRDFWKKIYMGALQHIWLSPLHRETYLIAFPELEKFKVTIPSCIDVSLWKPMGGIERKPNTVIGVNCLESFKGRYLVNSYVEKHPELHFTFVGNAPPINKSNCSYLPYVPNEELPTLYNQHEKFIHLPDHTEPFGRVSVESLLSGCKIITNENNGAFSYKWMKEGDVRNIREMMKQVGVAWWEEVEKSCGVKYLGVDS